jgi:hypothetical protein
MAQKQKEAVIQDEFPQKEGQQSYGWGRKLGAAALSSFSAEKNGFLDFSISLVLFQK